MKRHGLLGLLILLLAAPPAFSQASALANCKYYTKVQQDFEQGLPYCQEAVVENPEDPEARYVAAWCMAEMGQLEEAWESFNWLIERQESGDKDVKKHAKNASRKVDEYYARYFNKGVELLNAENTKDARDAFKWATMIDPRKTGARLNLGFTQTQLDDLEGAMSSFEAAVEMAPEDKTSREYYWDALSRKLQKVRAGDPPDPEALADVSAKLRATLEKLIEMDPTGAGAADAHLQLGDLDLAAGDKDAALGHMQRAIELAPESVVNLVNIGIEFYGNDDFANAVEALQIVLTSVDDPEDEIWRKATWVLGLSHHELEHFDLALEQYEKLLAQDPDNLEYLVKAGVAARKSGAQDRGDQYLIRWQELKDEQVMGPDGGTDG